MGALVGGRYELRTLIRACDAAASFAALDRETTREVAITVLNPSRAAANAAYARSVAAAAAVRGLHVPRFVAAAAGEAPYTVAESPPGASIAQLLLVTRTLGWERTLGLAEQALLIMQRAHAITGAAHRALTPERWYVDAEDAVVLTDFGLVELFGPDAAYRAPEQETSPGDLRSDVYALAAVVFAAIAGKRHEPRVPAHLRMHASVPFSIDALFTRALAQDPALRPEPAELRAELRELLGLPPAPPEAPAPAVVAEANLASPPPVVTRRPPPRPADEQTLILPDEPEPPRPAPKKEKKPAPAPRTLAGAGRSAHKHSEPIPPTVAGTEQSPFYKNPAPAPRTLAGAERSAHKDSGPIPRTVAGTEQSPFYRMNEAAARPAPRGESPDDTLLLPESPEPPPSQVTEVLPVTRTEMSLDISARPADDLATLNFKPRRQAGGAGTIAPVRSAAPATEAPRAEAPRAVTGPAPAISAAPATGPLPTVRGQTARADELPQRHAPGERTALRQFMASPAAHRWLLRLIVFNTLCVLLLLLLHVLG